ncbi:MAG: hypothetical protein AAF740_03305 [Bacteroidota bacterium]
MTQYDVVRKLHDRQWHTLAYWTADHQKQEGGEWKERRVRWIGYDKHEPNLKIHVEIERGQREVWIHLIAGLDGKYDIVFG